MMLNYYYLGVDYDRLTNSIGARLLQDIIACKNVADTYHKVLFICSPKAEQIRKAIGTLDVEVMSEKLETPNIYLVYKSGDYYPQVPPCIQVQRDFQVKKKNPKTLYLEHSTGHPLKDDTRISYSNLNRIYNHPNGFAPPDPALIMLWGPVKA